MIRHLSVDGPPANPMNERLRSEPDLVEVTQGVQVFVSKLVPSKLKGSVHIVKNKVVIRVQDEVAGRKSSRISPR